jgi:hypothetical protein
MTAKDFNDMIDQVIDRVHQARYATNQSEVCRDDVKRIISDYQEKLVFAVLMGAADTLGH